MRTRKSTGTPIKLPSRYQQPGTDDKGKPVPKAKAKRRARPKPKAKCLPNTKRVRSTSSRSDPKGNSSANPTLNVGMEAFPYGPLSGLGLNSPPETRMYPSEESNGGFSTRPLPADIEDPIDDKFSDNSDARSGGTEIVVLPSIPSSSSRQPPQNTNKIDQNPMICNDMNEGFSGRRCGEMVVMDGSDQDEILKYLSSLTEEELEMLLDPEMLPMDASRGGRPTRGESVSSTAEAARQDAGEVKAGPESASHHYCVPRNIAHQILHDIARLLSQGRIPTNEVNELLLPPAGQDHAAADEDDSSAESVGEGEHGAVKRGRGDAIAWNREKVFDNEDDADAWLETHSYGLQRTNYTKKYGFKRYYYCRDCGKPANHREESTTSVMAGGNPVGHQIYLHYETTSSRVVMFSNDGTHLHDEDAKKRGLAEEVKEFIERKVGEGVVDLPTIWDKILRRINKGKIQQEDRPKDKRQVKNYLARVKKATNGGSMVITMSDLISMTEEHSQLPGDQEPDKAFVVHKRFVDGSFQAIYSTRRCVEASRKAVMMSTDATYKVNFHGFPVLTLAMVDYHNHTFPIALAICGNEKIDDYRELFLSMDVGAAKMGLPSRSPTFIMADGAPAITRAAGQVFPAAGRAMCWYHMKKNVETFMRGLKMEERDENIIMRDLSYVQLATSQKAFFEMFRLFAAQHEPRHPELLKYIRESWVQNPPYNTWWEGFAPRLPSTNNGLESMNNQLKIKTLREKLPLGTFLTLVQSKVVPGYSEALNYASGSGDRQFEDIDDLGASKSLFVSAAKWAENEAMRMVELPQGTYVFVRSRGAAPSYLSLENVHKFLGTLYGRFEHPNFVSIAAMLSKIYMVTIPAGSTNWRHFNCTCPSFLKNKQCLHCIGVGARRGMLNQADRFSMPIQRNTRKPGRPRKAQPALAKSLTLDAAAQNRFMNF